MKKTVKVALLVVSTTLLISAYWIFHNKKQCPQKKSLQLTQTSTTTIPEGTTMSTEIITTNSGLKYIILKAPAADAKKPTKGQSVSVHYTGWLTKPGSNEPDLTNKFDSSVDRGQPFRFQVGLGSVIAGWDEGVLSMAIGEKRQFIIPSNLGYGARGAAGVIPPNATLVFDVELLKIS